MSNLSILLPTRNRPGLLYKTLKSFLDLNLQKSQIIVIDNNSTKIETIGDKKFSTKDVIDYFSSDRIKYLKFDKNLNWDEIFITYQNHSKNFSYFSFLSDDDIFVQNDGLKIAINHLNENNNTSFVLTSSSIFQNDFKANWEREFIIHNKIVSGKEYLKLFCTEESYQHSSVTGIFRIKNLKDTNCFEINKTIKKNNLQAGYGIDNRVYFRNSLKGNIFLMGNYKTRKIRFHTGGMTFYSPIESTYCYYWSIKENINYCKQQGLVIKEFQSYLLYWINNLLTCNIIERFCITKDKNSEIIKKIIKKNYINYILEEVSKNNLILGKHHLFYLNINRLIKFIPTFLIKKIEGHFIPKNYIEFFFHLHPFYVVKFF